MQIHPRINFEWKEVLLVIINIVNSATSPLLCSGPIFAQVFYALSCLNGLRIFTRIHIFKSHRRTLQRSILFLLKIFPITFFILLVTVIVAFSIFRKTVNGCSLSAFLEPISLEKCSANGGQLSPYLLNYETFSNGLLSQYLFMNKCEWHRLLGTFVQGWQGSSFYIGIMIVMALLVPGFLNLIFRATSAGVCYTVLGQLSLVNTDSNANLSPPQIELVRIQEELCKTKLKKKPQKITNKWSLFCLKLRRSKVWRYFFYISIFVAFGLNLTPYTSLD